MTKDTIYDLIDQFEAEGSVYLIAYTEVDTKGEHSMTVRDNIRASELRGYYSEEPLESLYLDDIEANFMAQGRV